MGTFFCEGCESKKHKIAVMPACARTRVGQHDEHSLGQNVSRLSQASFDSRKYQNEDERHVF